MSQEEVYKACADQDHEKFACELPKGHDGPHKALVGTDDEVAWESSEQSA